MEKTPRQKWRIAWGVFLLAVSVSVVLGVLTKHGAFVIPALISVIVFAIWRMQFSCPKCNMPLLWRSQGILIFPRVMGDRCPSCGWPTDQVATAASSG